MSRTISVRISPLRASSYSSQRSHDLRTGQVPAYIAQARAHLNSGGNVPEISDVHSANEDFKQAARDAAQARLNAAMQINDAVKIAEAKKAINACRKAYDKTGIVAYSGILTYGTDARLSVIEALDHKEQDELALQAINRAAKVVDGKAFGITAHRDEAAVHYHFYILGTNYAGKKINPRKTDLRKMQDEAAKPYNKYGITRGKSKETHINEGNASKTIHKTVAELHEELPRDLAKAQAELEALQANVTQQAQEYELLKLRCEGAQAQLEKFNALLEKTREIKKNYAAKTYEVVTDRGLLTTKTQNVALYTRSDFDAFARDLSAALLADIEAAEKQLEAGRRALEREKEHVSERLKASQASLAQKEIKLLAQVELLDIFAATALRAAPGLATVDLTQYIESKIEHSYSTEELQDIFKSTALSEQVDSACEKIEIKLEQQYEEEQELEEEYENDWGMR